MEAQNVRWTAERRHEEQLTSENWEAVIGKREERGREKRQVRVG
jgi:hypothetical protein